jgi:hypothetical protein
MPPRSKGRTGRPWRRAAAAIRKATDICSICGHSGARTVHHDPPLKTLEELGLDPRDPEYLRIAHGAPRNPCPTCGLNCNQVAGSKVGFVLPTATASRNW